MSQVKKEKKKKKRGTCLELVLARMDRRNSQTGGELGGSSGSRRVLPQIQSGKVSRAVFVSFSSSYCPYRGPHQLYFFGTCKKKMEIDPQTLKSLSGFRNAKQYRVVQSIDSGCNFDEAFGSTSWPRFCGVFAVFSRSWLGFVFIGFFSSS